MSLVLLALMILAGWAGALAHECAHWLVWRATGRDPDFQFWQLTVRPRAGPSHTTPGDRVAAAAPYCLGLLAALVGVWRWDVVWVVFGLAAFQVPSRSDVAAMRGRAEWAIGE